MTIHPHAVTLTPDPVQNMKPSDQRKCKACVAVIEPAAGAGGGGGGKKRTGKKKK